MGSSNVARRLGAAAGHQRQPLRRRDHLLQLPRAVPAAAARGVDRRLRPARATRTPCRRLFDKIAANAPGQVGTTLKDSIKAAINARAEPRHHRPGRRAAHRARLDRQPARGDRRGLEAGRRRRRTRSSSGWSTCGILAGARRWRCSCRSASPPAGRRSRHEILSCARARRRPGHGHAARGRSASRSRWRGDAVIFFFVLTRLPRADVHVRVGDPRRDPGRGRVRDPEDRRDVHGRGVRASSATAGPFAGLLAVLVWIQLVTRWVLFCAAWTAELTVRRHGRRRALPSSRDARPSGPSRCRRPRWARPGRCRCGRRAAVTALRAAAPPRRRRLIPRHLCSSRVRARPLRAAVGRGSNASYCNGAVPAT